MIEDQELHKLIWEIPDGQWDQRVKPEARTEKSYQQSKNLEWPDVSADKTVSQHKKVSAQHIDIQQSFCEGRASMKWQWKQAEESKKTER